MTNEVDRERNRLLQEIRAEAWDTRDYTGRAAFDERTMQALQSVPRHEFVEEGSLHRAYANHPLPIGHGQTISQPYIVALMTDLIQPEADDVVLEIGTGCGYQAAVLSRLVERVYSVEIVDELARDATQRLRRLGYDNIEVRSGNGRLGWPQHAPYDAILVTAAASQIPPALIAQLKIGARLVIPLGYPHAAQELVMVERLENGRVEQRPVLPVAFVPLTGSSDEQA